MGTFKDNNGREWTPEITAYTLSLACQEMDIPLSKLTEMDVSLGQLVNFLWYACEPQAISRSVTRENFMKSLGLDEMRTAITTLWGVIQKSFPEVANEGDNTDPLAPGKSTT